MITQHFKLSSGVALTWLLLGFCPAPAVAQVKPAQPTFNLAAKTGTVDVADFGAKGDGSTDDLNALRAAIATGKQVRLGLGKTYVCSGQLTLSAGQRLDGNQSTLFLAPQVHTTTATTITSSTTSIVVASTTGLKIGMNINVADHAVAQANLSAGTSLSTTNSQITAINGSTVTVSPAFNAAISSGTADVYTSCYQIVTAANSVIRDLVVDGNVANNAWGRWEITNGIRTQGDRNVIEHVTLQNMSGEGIYVANGSYNTIRDCTINTCNGNGMHLSAVTGTVVDHVTVINPNGNTANGHADGCILASNQVSNTTITNCFLSGGVNGIGSFDSADNSDATFTNNTITGASNCGIDVANTSSDNYAVRVVITGNRIYNCGAIDGGGLTLQCIGTASQTQYYNISNNLFSVGGLAILSQNPVSGKLPPADNIVSGNTFIGCGIQTQGVYRTTFSNNQIDRTGDSTSGHHCINNIVDVVNCKFLGNRTRGGDNGIVFAGGTITDNIIANNDVLLPGTAGISIAGTSASRNTIQGNSVDKSNDVTPGNTHQCFAISSSNVKNRWLDNTAIGGDYGFYSGAAQTDSEWSRNNSYAAGTTAFQFINSGSGLLVSQNKADKTGDSTANHQCFVFGATLTNSRVTGNYAIGGSTAFSISTGADVDTMFVDNISVGANAAAFGLSGNASSPGLMFRGNKAISTSVSASSWTGFNCGMQKVGFIGNEIDALASHANYGLLLGATSADCNALDNIVRGTFAVQAFAIIAGATNTTALNNLTTSAISDAGTTSHLTGNAVIN